MNLKIFYEKELDIIFNNILYKQTDGVNMGSVLRLSLANTFLAHREQNWSDSCPFEYRPWYYRWYVDDIFVLFKSSDHWKRFQSYLNSCHVNTLFTIETEQNNKTSFLNVNVISEQGRFITSNYRKTAFSGAYTLLNSLLTDIETDA